MKAASSERRAHERAQTFGKFYTAHVDAYSFIVLAELLRK